MRIAIIGYGKMGKEIEQIAISRGHQIGMIIDVDNPHDLTASNLKQCDAAIEFTVPESAVKNYGICFEAGIPVVSGTTGWLNRKNEVHEKCKANNGTFFYSSNFSIGANIFFKINRELAAVMATHPEYGVEIKETHHIHKLDAPSGTAISIAEDIIGILPAKTGWVNDKEPAQNQINIQSERRGEISGIHTVKYESEIDSIEITHSAKTRKGLAFGAVLAAEYSINHSGIITMNELINNLASK